MRRRSRGDGMTNRSCLELTSTPGKQDVVSIISVKPGGEAGEGLATLAEGGLEAKLAQARCSGCYARLGPIAMVHIKVQQSHPLDACSTRHTPLHLMSSLSCHWTHKDQDKQMSARSLLISVCIGPTKKLVCYASCLGAGHKESCEGKTDVTMGRTQQTVKSRAEGC